ncbi:MAG: hypothetical protein HRT69_02335 [Flavobacteriaceae bacterium]|nr:hypothetical protein [Flavobacteriaceae bacterium]
MKNILKIIILITLIISLLIAIYTTQENGFYQYVRWLVFLSGIYFCYFYYKSSTENTLLWLFLVMIVLYNPVFQIHLGDDAWKMFDGVIILISSYSLLERSEKVLNPLFDLRDKIGSFIDKLPLFFKRIINLILSVIFMISIFFIFKEVIMIIIVPILSFVIEAYKYSS